MKARVLTAVVGIPPVLAVVGCTNPWPLAVLLGLLAFLCGRELDLLFEQKVFTPGLFSLAMFSWWLIKHTLGGGVDSWRDNQIWPLMAAGLFVAGVASLWAVKRRSDIKSLTFGILVQAGLFWILMPFLFLLLFHSQIRTEGMSFQLPNAILLVLLPVWAGDIAAMLGGIAIGKHLLAPKISPKKTWEGAICNFIAATLVGWGVGSWLGYQPWVGPACGVAVGIFGQLGDLFESALKRAAGKKDSGTLLPGHGGILDRIDALLASVIPVWLILHFSGSI